ncbi:hypothetical protein PQE70_gp055 [Bacillus phage vB_BanS_Nate]|uniref:Uncharacterized protein n=1 Tax=Bacillus phage vB_BanS_Nate TaxID=2894788 RepID=A0AAE8YU92_9CAUD|nr:hypothetical protein PQE70_gp055 [Bacillus phage vB_BanS_Nate]UGO50908.1 hypothetical protein NATE_55 [Bacillus phage vB_BanS_Nate]
MEDFFQKRVREICNADENSEWRESYTIDLMLAIYKLIKYEHENY